MERHRVIVANDQRLLREMLTRVIKKLPDFQVVGTIKGIARLPHLIEKTGAQWVILSLQANGTMPEGVTPLLRLYPQLGILALSADGGQVKMKALLGPEQDWHNTSFDNVLATLRAPPFDEAKVCA